MPAQALARAHTHNFPVIKLLFFYFFFFSNYCWWLSETRWHLDGVYKIGKPQTAFRCFSIKSSFGMPRRGNYIFWYKVKWIYFRTVFNSKVFHYCFCLSIFFLFCKHGCNDMTFISEFIRQHTEALVSARETLPQSRFTVTQCDRGFVSCSVHQRAERAASFQSEANKTHFTVGWCLVCQFSCIMMENSTKMQ